MIFPPLDVGGRPIECGVWIQYRTARPKGVAVGEVVSIVVEQETWIVSVLTPHGIRVILQGVEGCRVVEVPPGLQVDEGYSLVNNATNPVSDSRGD